MIRVLTFTTLYPNGAAPQHGVFVENRLNKLIDSGRVEARVVAPVPWFPSRHPRYGAYAKYAAAPVSEQRRGLTILHPRYFLLPKIGMTLAPLLLYLGARRTVKTLRADGFDFDLIDAHYFYPDGVAAALLAREFGKPFSITGRGTDLNFIPRYTLPRRMILWAAAKASAMITVCQALKDDLTRIGVDPARVTVLRNGVDLRTFVERDREGSRQRLGLDGRTAIVSVGALIPRKGHDLTIRALAELPDCVLLIAGQGAEETRLKALAESLGVADRARFLGQVAHEDLPALYSAADIMVLASSKEGWANVLLESMACGTPVVATDAGGTREVVDAPEAGLVVGERTPDAIAAGIREVLSHPRDRTATRRYAEAFSWDATTDGQLQLFGAMLAQRPGAPTAAPVALESAPEGR